MADDQNTIVSFGADTDALESGVKQAAQSVDDATNKIADSCKNVGSSSQVASATTVESFQAMVAGLAPVAEEMNSLVSVATGGFSKIIEMVEAAAAALTGMAGVSAVKDEAAEIKKLVNTFGLSSEAASNLNTQLKSVGLSAEEYAGMAMKMDRQLKSNETGMNDMGIKTRDASGAYLSQQDIMSNASKALQDYQIGTDRNAASMAIFGRNSEGAAALLKLNADNVARAADMNEKLGITMTDEKLANVKQFGIAMSGAGIAIEALGIKIGEAIMPTLTMFGNMILQLVENIMPVWDVAAEAFGVIFQAVGTIIGAVGSGIMEIFTAIGTACQQIFGALLPQDFSMSETAIRLIVGAVGILKNVFLGLIDTVVYIVQHIVTDFTTMYQVLDDIFKLKDPTKSFESGMAKIDAVNKEYTDKIIARSNDAANAVAGISGHGATGDWGKTGTKKYEGNDKKEKGSGKSGGAGEVSYIDKLTTDLATQKLAYEQFYANIGQLRQASKQQEADYWNGALDQTNLTEKERNAIKQKYATLELAINQQKIKETQEIGKLQLQDAKIVADGEMTLAEENAKEQNQLGVTSKAEYLSILQGFQNQKRQIDVRAQQEELNQYEVGSVSYEKVKQKMLQADLKYSAEAMKTNFQITQEATKDWTTMFTSMETGFSKAIAGFVVGTMTYQKAMKSMYDSVIQSFATFIEKQISGYLMTSAAQLLGLGVAKSEATAKGTSAAIGAADSVADIPVVGPELAIGAYASIMSLVSGGINAIPSAAGGFDIPAGVNPMTQLHQNEMVLPSHLANAVRDMAASGGRDGGSRSGDVHLHVSALDAHSVRRLFESNGSTLADVLKQQARNLKR